MADDPRSTADASGGPGWSEAYAQLADRDAAGELDLAGLERLAVAAYMVGRDRESVDGWQRAHAGRLERREVRGAARCAFWLGLELMNRGEMARAGGWLQRGLRLMDDVAAPCAENGLLLALAARTHAMRGEVDAAQRAAAEALALAGQFDDVELAIFARLACAQIGARCGDVVGAIALFDEIMVAVTVDEVSPVAVGTAYCAVIEGCHALYDVGRAREWTAALSRWCRGQRDLVPFRGRCLIHRVEIMRLSGAWSEAIREAEEACRWLLHSAADRETVSTGADLPSFKYPVGAVYYELAELHRRRGDHGDADAAYRRASEYGRSPQPGLALLRLDQGRLDEAEAAIRRVLDETRAGPARRVALSAAVEVLLAVNDVEAARSAADELAVAAADSGATYLRALAGEARGRVLLAQDESAAALTALGESWRGWQELEAPYEGARVRELRAVACQALGDADAATLELDAAQRVFERLGARPAVERAASLRSGTAAGAGTRAGVLSPRERQVIALVAKGMTNQAVADELCISRRTVDRHVSNILLKLDLPSRTAAAAYAWQHGLV